MPVEQTAPAAEMPNRRFPLILNTGRMLYHWHGGTMTRRVEGLMARAPDLEISIHPRDAKRAGIGDGEEVRVESRRGELEGRAAVTEAVREGEIFVPFVKLRDSAVKLRDSAANFLTNRALHRSLGEDT